MPIRVPTLLRWHLINAEFGGIAGYCILRAVRTLRPNRSRRFSERPPQAFVEQMQVGDADCGGDGFDR